MILYSEAKDYMQTGDMLFWHGHNLLGKAIQVFSKGEFNHASMIIRLGDCEGLNTDRRFHTEAIGKGVLPNLISRKIVEYDGEVWWCQLKPEWESVRPAIALRLAEWWGVNYDFGSLFKNAISRVSADANKLFCSELCWLALGLDGKAPTPVELFNKDLFQRKEQLIYKHEEV